jgi:signal peptidase II
MTALRRRRPYLFVVAAILVLDQVTKWLVVGSLELHEYRPVIDGLLSLSHVRNRGAAFGILSEADLPYQALLFASLSLAALVAIGVYAWRLPLSARLPQLALSLILGGALGNLIDRLRLGYVIDFVHVYWRDYQWPDFNAADSAITIGVSLLVLDILRAPQPETPGGAEIAPAATSAKD